MFAASAPADDWPDWRGPQRDGVWRESGVVNEFDEEQIPIKWRMPIGAGYSGPTVADGRVYVSDRIVEPQQIERVHCFDSMTGKSLWKYEYPCEYRVSYTAGPRACVVIDDGRAFALGTMGHFHCFDSATGAVLWKKDLNAEYQIESADRRESRMPIWGLAAAPLIVDDHVILHIGGREGACIVSLDKKSGEEQWRALNDRASYSAPIIIEQAGRRVVVCWTADSASGLNPETGEVYWRYPFGPSRMPIGVATPIVEDDRLYMTSFYDGSLALKLHEDRPQVSKLWRAVGRDERNTEALHSIISTPMMKDGYIYGVDSYGELRCLNAETGERIWEDLTATPNVRWSTIHFVQHGEETWMFNQQGELIIGKLSPSGFEEIDRAKLLEPTRNQLPRRGGVCWSHPAFAEKHVFARNDKEIVCASLEAD